MRHAIGFIVLAAFVGFSSTGLEAAQGKSRGPKPPVAHGPKATTNHGPKSPSARSPKATSTRGTKSPTTPSSRATGKKTAQVATTATNLPKNPQLVDRLRMRLGLPPGTDMAPFAAGFKNQGQFMATVNVSQNLGISFTELKSLMLNDGLSLGQAIQRLRPGVNADNEVRRATSQSPR